jgi:hypothetical protein
VSRPKPKEAFGRPKDEDKKPTRAGSLERDKPTDLLIETL